MCSELLYTIITTYIGDHIVIIVITISPWNILSLTNYIRIILTTYPLVLKYNIWGVENKFVGLFPQIEHSNNK